ncbi:phosphoribosylformylglycinamidine synthase subunit PurL [Corynebacterium otitidis]|uniref:phosphoribosylformylglycinamidine synthase subunit PurL n=1 Tax=Corynebacterium otitidis TaxID=29321 RepID=UPI000627820F|nr:phosphoribosylformylglycinamidine synthase subunit PurL [Corynebacterium otitidis]KKO84186.1 phosphoribosylformylglycinamidine synthase [Corynebacterium otitidis]
MVAPIENDTVSRAEAEPELAQPYAELGLKPDEYERIREILGRRPTDAELTMYSVMWSEHCSYKSSKVHLRYFGETTTEEMASKLLAGIGENAGVVDIGDGNAVTFRVESHNHPSYVEPHQGAATGVGGIVRDIMAMGARPIAVMDQLRFGPAEALDTQRVLPGVVGGISSYGNSLGLPNIGGETVFDPSYAGNPLVNALCVGSLKTEDLKLAFASGTGNKVMLFGSRTGLDGIGGVSVLASDSFADGAERKLPSVQVGDPFAEKVLIECCLELYRAGVVVGIQDLGGAGLACATSELAAAGDGGMAVDLDAVPLRSAEMSAAEILASESQERMCAVVTPENVETFRKICERWEVTCAEIGEVTTGDRLVIRHRGEVVVDAPAATIADEAPVYERPFARPENQDDIQNEEPLPESGDLAHTLTELVSSPALCSRAFITNQYDRYVRGNTIKAKGSDAGVLRIDEETGRGVAVSADASGHYTYLEPNTGARLALAEAYRNVAATGARPVAVTNCLNFGSPEDPGVMWQFREAVHGLADGAAELGIPVSGGNVSFYNQTGEEAILPTPVVGVLGVIDDVAAAHGHEFGSVEGGEAVFVLGDTFREFGGSAYQELAGVKLSGLPPKVDLKNEERLADLLVGNELVTAAHDISEGGIAQAVLEMAMPGGHGVDLDLSDVHEDLVVALFSESASRVVVATRPEDADAFAERARAAGVPARRVGETTGLPVFAARSGEQSLPEVSVEDLRRAWEDTLPRLFAHPAGNNSAV